MFVLVLQLQSKINKTSDSHSFQMRKLVTGLSFVLMHLTMGVCKTQTGYLRMADADGKMRMKNNADNKNSKKEKTRNADGKKNK